MADQELERTVRKLRVEHAETRWLALRLDDDVKEIRGELREIRQVQDEHTARFVAVERELDEVRSVQVEHTARFDSVDASMRSLTQMVGQVLDRLPEPGNPSPPGHEDR